MRVRVPRGVRVHSVCLVISLCARKPLPSHDAKRHLRAAESARRPELAASLERKGGVSEKKGIVLERERTLPFLAVLPVKERRCFREERHCC